MDVANRRCHKLAPSLRPGVGVLSAIGILEQLRTECELRELAERKPKACFAHRGRHLRGAAPEQPGFRSCMERM
jgi:hypothetical protein